MGYEAIGKIHSIDVTKQVSERFSKREFVVELNDNPKYPQLVQFQATGDRCEQLDGLAKGDEVQIEFSLRGREWTSPKQEVRYFNSLDVWKVERRGEKKQASKPAGNAPGAPATNDAAPPPTDDDCPF
jgi:hypothetical protein